MSNAEVLSDPRLFIRYWFEKKNLVVRGNLICKGENKPFELSMVFNAMWLDYREDLRFHNIEADENARVKGFPEKDLTKALEEFLEVKRQEALTEIKALIKFTEESDEELRRFVTAVTGKCDEVELSVYKHILWQVKRKMFNKKVYDHMMIVLKGKQGGGKTEAVKALFRFIKAWFKCASLAEVTDDRWKHFYKNAFVVFCDELQYAERTDIDALKNMISAEEFEARRLGHNIYDHLSQNATFVGATNKHLFELFRDPTGMRRFFESKAMDKMDWSTINGIDTQKIWQSINEDQEVTYISPFKTQILDLQTELVVTDPDEEFLEAFRFTNENAEERRDKFISNEAVYSIYERYCEQHGERKRTSIQFHKKIKARGMRQFEARSGQGGTRGYWVSEKVMKLMTKYKTGVDYYIAVSDVFGESPSNVVSKNEDTNQERGQC